MLMPVVTNFKLELNDSRDESSERLTNKTSDDGFFKYWKIDELLELESRDAELVELI